MVTDGSETFAGSSNGVTRTILPGTYAVAQSTLAGYTTDYSNGCFGTIAAGDAASCAIVNNDAPPGPGPPAPNPPPGPNPPPAPGPGEPATLTVITVFSGGSRVPADFVDLISGTPVISGGPVFRGEASPGVTRTVQPGSYGVFQTKRLDYSRSFSDQFRIFKGACRPTVAGPELGARPGVHPV